MGIVTRRVVECAFLTRLSCQSMLAVVLLPLLLPVRLRGANSLSLPLAWGHGLALRSVPAEQSGRVAFSRGNWLCWIRLCSNPVEQEGWGWGSARGGSKTTHMPDLLSCSSKERQDLAKHIHVLSVVVSSPDFVAARTRGGV